MSILDGSFGYPNAVLEEAFRKALLYIHQTQPHILNNIAVAGNPIGGAPLYHGNEQQVQYMSLYIVLIGFRL
jgi:hypothetical protein